MLKPHFADYSDSCLMDHRPSQAQKYLGVRNISVVLENSNAATFLWWGFLEKATRYL